MKNVFDLSRLRNLLSLEYCKVKGLMTSALSLVIYVQSKEHVIGFLKKTILLKIYVDKICIILHFRES